MDVVKGLEGLCRCTMIDYDGLVSSTHLQMVCFSHLCPNKSNVDLLSQFLFLGVLQQIRANLSCTESMNSLWQFLVKKHIYIYIYTSFAYVIGLHR